MTNPEPTGQSKFRFKPEPRQLTAQEIDAAIRAASYTAARCKVELDRMEAELERANKDWQQMTKLASKRQGIIDALREKLACLEQANLQLRSQLSPNPGEFAGEGERDELPFYRCPLCGDEMQQPFTCCFNHKMTEAVRVPTAPKPVLVPKSVSVPEPAAGGERQEIEKLKSALELSQSWRNQWFDTARKRKKQLTAANQLLREYFRDKRIPDDDPLTAKLYKFLQGERRGLRSMPLHPSNQCEHSASGEVDCEAGLHVARDARCPQQGVPVQVVEESREAVGDASGSPGLSGSCGHAQAVAALPPGQEQEERWLRQAAQAALRSTGRCEWRGGGVDRHPSATFDAIEVRMVMREMRQFFNAAINEAKDECHRHEDERLAALRKQVAEGEKDTKRLDWLSIRNANVSVRDECRISLYSVEGSLERRIGGAERSTLREALDDAMAAQESKAHG